MGHVKVTDFGFSENNHKIKMTDIMPSPKVAESLKYARTPGQIASLSSKFDFNNSFLHEPSPKLFRHLSTTKPSGKNLFKDSSTDSSTCKSVRSDNIFIKKAETVIDLNVIFYNFIYLH